MIKVIILGVLLLCVVWLFATLERRTLYYPVRAFDQTPEVYRLPYEDVHLKTLDGKKIHGWFFPAENPDKAITLLLSHGNAGNISHRLSKVLRLRGLGVNIFLYDYRGYGLSEGDPSEAGTYADAEAAYRHLTEKRGILPQAIVHYGESLGCAVALETALRYSSGGLILESPFTSTVAMGKIAFPFLPVQWLVRQKYDNLAKIHQLKTPLLLLHSPEDEIVPFRMGKQLFEKAPEPKQLVELLGGHNDGYEVSGKTYIDGVARYLQTIRKEKNR